MTAELWLVDVSPCVHGALKPHNLPPPLSRRRCFGGSVGRTVRLDPDQVVEVRAAAVWSNGIGQNKTLSAIRVKDIIDALTDTNGTIVSFTQETDQ